MNRRWLVGGGLGLLAIAAAAPAIQDAVTDPGVEPIVAEESAPKRVAEIKAATPMAERVATIGILNKRNGLSRNLQLTPGQGVRINDIIVKLRACDQTEPWEKDQLTGAFVQMIVLGSDEKWRRMFSGWLFKETPSLNVVEHPVYDVWVKACTMRHPDVGPNTVVMSTGDSGDTPTRSRARKSPEASSEPVATVPVTAESSNSI
jgi:hypothetical protein